VSVTNVLECQTTLVQDSFHAVENYVACYSRIHVSRLVGIRLNRYGLVLKSE